MTEAQKEEKNKEHRLQSWNEVVEQVKSNKINFNSLHWKNAVTYLMKDIGFKIKKEEFNEYQEKASEILRIELKKTMADLTVRNDERSRANSLYVDLLDYNFKDPDLASMVTTIRQKLVARDYIMTQIQIVN